MLGRRGELWADRDGKEAEERSEGGRRGNSRGRRITCKHDAVSTLDRSIDRGISNDVGGAARAVVRVALQRIV